MTITHVVMLIGILVAAAVALTVGHLQRKQMRQIELYRRDPTVGLIPPSNFLTRFVGSRWDSIIGFGAPSIGLIVELFDPAPVNRISVLLISISIAFLFLHFVMIIVFRLFDRTIALITELTASHKEHFQITERAVSALSRVVDKFPENGT